ncbi:hypothetical protein P4O66_005928, partial [Electrophorus voltai]
MPGTKGKERKGKIGCKRHPTAPAGNPSILLGPLQTPTTGESPAGGFCRGPECGLVQWGPVLGVRLRRALRTCHAAMDYHEGYMDSGRKEEYIDIILRSDFESDREEDPSKEVEEILHMVPPSVSDTVDSKSDEPPAPKAPPKSPPRARRSKASKLPRCVRPCVRRRPGPCPFPAVLFALARVGSLGPPASPFGVGFGAVNQTLIPLSTSCLQTQ